MAESVTLVTQPRQGRGTRSARRLRHQGRIPAVLYGHKKETLSIALPAEDVERAVRHGLHVVDLQSDGDLQKVLIREVQWDHLGKSILHIDLARVAADERIRVPVPLELRGTAPGVNAGGVLDQPLHSVEVECLALSVPESIRVNISELQLGGAIHVRDLVLPPDVKAMADPDAIVVHVTTVAAEAPAAATPAAEAPEQAEPEVIGRQRAAEEEGE
jgi:large subunit ribosomal protein L25